MTPEGTYVDGRQWRSIIAAAQAGDRRALDELVAGWLPLVYNIVGRALNGHADVDDVVQETMLRAVGNLGSLRDPDSFRSWLVAITMRQIRERSRRRTAEPLADGAGEQAADFAELTVLRLQLEGQRREVAEAVRWLDDEDRQLLSLWWLEVAGELTRRELAAAVGISRQHAAVRVQRMKQRLETARDIVRALDGDHPGAGNSPCPDLRLVTARWDGRPDSVWRKRVARHIRGCAYCSGAREAVVPAERLLVGIALVPLPVGFTLSLALGGKTAVAATSVGWSAKLLGLLTKPAVAVTAGATLAAGGLYVVTRTPDDPPPALAAPTAASTARPPSGRTGEPSASPAPSPSPPPPRHRLRRPRRPASSSTAPSSTPSTARPPPARSRRRCPGAPRRVSPPPARPPRASPIAGRRSPSAGRATSGSAGRSCPSSAPARCSCRPGPG
nr:sigma-70 family RNA polymerase sigma factor [Streptomyces sp. RLB1-33]